MINLNSKEITDLLENFKKTGDIKIRDEIFEKCKENIDTIIFFQTQHSNVAHSLVEDIKQEGYLGAITSISKYKIGGNFNSCVNFWIKKYMFRCGFSQSRTIRIPSTLNRKIKKMKTYRDTFLEQKGKTISSSELCNVFKIKGSKRGVFRYFLNKNESILPFEIEDKGMGNGPSSLVDRALWNERLPFQDGLDLESSESLKSALDKLTEKEKLIIFTRFNLELKGKRNLRELGNTLDITSQRVQQIEKKALSKMREHINRLDSVPRSNRASKMANCPRISLMKSVHNL